MHPRIASLLVVLLAVNVEAATQSHSPMRPLPEASRKPLGEGFFRHADAAKGDDKHDGSRDKPWRSLRHALTQLKPGETLLLRGGTFHENVTLSLAGSADKPITLRSHPGELAILDGGLREFVEEPAKAWEPVADGTK